VAAEKRGPETDTALWERICAGDAEAFDGFYRENALRLRGFLRLLTGTIQAAEDVMQETFTQMWRSPNGFQPERGSLRAYLFGIGRKRAAEWRRKQKSSCETGVSTESTAVENKETLTTVSDAFARLRVEQQSLLWLREVEGQSYAELAEILDIPVGTVRSRLFAAREELRRIWHSSSLKARNKT
jgi:RNA polymerase sigma-70 factor, ECF subfamily